MSDTATLLAVVPGKGRVLLAGRNFEEDEVIFRDVPIALASDLIDACSLCPPLQQRCVDNRHCLADCPVSSTSPFLRFALAINNLSTETGVSCPSLRLLLAILTSPPPDLSSRNSNVISSSLWSSLLTLDAGFSFTEANQVDGISEVQRLACASLKQKCLSAGQKIKPLLDSQTCFDGSVEDLATLLGVLQCNSHAVDAITGKGISRHISMLEHSCNPSAYITSSVVEGKDSVCIQLRALRRISKGEALSIKYWAAHASTEDRQQYLLENYCFVCTCPLCNGPDLMRTFLCPNDWCPGIVCPAPSASGKTWFCANRNGTLKKCCGNQADLPTMQSWLRAEEKLRKQKEGIPQELFLIAQAAGLHKSHFLVPNSRLNSLQ